MRFETLTVHSGHHKNARNQPASPPVERSTSWSFTTMAELEHAFATGDGYFYGRNDMPTTAMLEEAITALENGHNTLVYATGMAAIASVLAVAGAGKRVLAAPDLYGLTYRLLQTWLPDSGAEVRFVDVQDQTAVAAALADWYPQLLVAETLSNPLVKVGDLPWLVERAREVGCKIMVDNTFASPYLLRPADLGVDYTVESLTKYMNGHGDVLGGSVTTRDEADHAALLAHRTTFGATLDPQAAWLSLRGLRTLALRMQRQSQNAADLAAFLADHPAVSRAYYPGLSTHPDHTLASNLFAGRGFGGMLAFNLVDATRQRAWEVMDRLQLALRAPTLGDVATLVSHPAQASHRGLTPDQRAAVGIGEGLIRVSVGIEASTDIIADFAQALT